MHKNCNNFSIERLTRNIVSGWQFDQTRLVFTENFILVQWIFQKKIQCFGKIMCSTNLVCWVNLKLLDLAKLCVVPIFYPSLPICFKNISVTFCNPGSVESVHDNVATKIQLRGIRDGTCPTEKLQIGKRCSRCCDILRQSMVDSLNIPW